MTEQRIKLTKRTVDKIRPPESGEVVIWDRAMPGFGIRVKASGVMSYVVQYRNREGRSRRKTLGRHGILTPEQARGMAQNMLTEAKQGSDPAQEQQDMRKALTVRALCDRYLKEHAEQHKRASSVKEDRRLIDNRIIPALGAMKVFAVTRADLAKLHHDMRETPYEANRTLALVSKILNLAEKWSLRPDGSNPCRHIQRYREAKRERYLTMEELSRLGETLDRLEAEGTEKPVLLATIKLLLFTGARLSEICGLRWDGLNLEHGTVRLAESKTGPKTLYLNPPALAVIEALERNGPYLLPRVRDANEPMSAFTIEHAWKRIRDKAELPEVRLHDFRHTFASWAVMGGASLPATGALLGHSVPSTTSRYAHFAAAPLRSVSDAIGTRLAEGLNARGCIEWLGR